MIGDDRDPDLGGLLGSVGALLSAAEEDRQAADGDVTAAVQQTVKWLMRDRPPVKRRTVDRLVAAAVLLDYGDRRHLAETLLNSCGKATEGRRAQQIVSSAQAAIEARRGNWERVEELLRHVEPSEPLDERTLRIAVDLALSAVYGRGDLARNDLMGEAGIQAFRDRPVLWFTLASAAFENAMMHARADHARALLREMDVSSGAVLEEIGVDHPYLGFVLLTLASAKCSRAATDGNLRELRRYADILAIAVQRAASQLGGQHPHTFGGLANLAHAEFEIALASKSVDDLTRSVDDLRFLSRRARNALGRLHPTAVIVGMNAAVAGLELARSTRSVVSLDRAARELRASMALATETFGMFHPRAALAAANSASAEFDVARSRRSTLGLEQALEVFQQTRWQTVNSLGENHAVAVVLRRQIQACRALLSAGPPTDDRTGGGRTATVVETRTDELWDVGGDYVSVHQATLPPSGLDPQVAVNDVGSGDDLVAAIEDTLKSFEDGDLVVGTIVKVDRDEVLLDIGYKTEGVIPSRELSIKHDVDPAEVVTVGDEVEALVLQKEDKEGRLILSKKRAQYERAWGRIEEHKRLDEPIRGTVIEVVRGGLILDIGLRGFLPASLVEMRRVRDLQPYVGRELEAKIIELDKDRNNVVLSRRALLEETRSSVRGEFLNALAKGQVRRGVVSSILNFGAFVDLGGVEGMVHVSELSWRHIDHPSEVVEVGQEIAVEVLDVDVDRERVSLSLKATQEDPWRQFARTHAIGQIVPGKVTKLVPFGAFVRVEEGIEGLVHISELAEYHVEIPEQVVQVGLAVIVKVIDIDLDRRRVSLSLKQANEGVTPDIEFDPTQYGMVAEYDAEGNYIYPDGFDPEIGEWVEGSEKQRAEWERRYTEARARYEAHMAQVRRAADEMRAEAPPAQSRQPADAGSGSLSSDERLVALREKLGRDT